MPSTEHGSGLGATMFRLGATGPAGLVYSGGGGPPTSAYCGGGRTAPAATIMDMLAAARIDPRAFLSQQSSMVPNPCFENNHMVNSLTKLQQTEKFSNGSASSNGSSSSNVDVNSIMPLNIPPNPRLWSRADVNTWLEWSEKEFSLTSFKTESFAMNGKALCLLNKQDFRDRVPSAGDVLYNTLQIIMKNASRVQVFTNDSESFQENLKNGFNANDSNINNHSMHRHLLPGKTHHHSSSDKNNGGGENRYVMATSPAPSSDSGNHSAANSPEYASSRHHSDSPRDDPTSNQTSRFTFSDECISDMEEDNYGEEEVPNMVYMEPSTPPAAATAHAPTVSSSPVVKLHKNTFSNENNGGNNGHQDYGGINRDTLSSGRLLWDFLQQLLNDAEQRYRHCIVWRDKELRIFKIVDPQALAKLWGIHKNHLNMNFDKMSRALRYYYRVNILRKEHGEKHSYRFLRHPAELRHCRQKSLLNIPPKSIADPSNASKATRVFPTSNVSPAEQAQAQAQAQQQLQQSTSSKAEEAPPPSPRVNNSNFSSFSNSNCKNTERGTVSPSSNDQLHALNLRVKDEPHSPK